MWAVVAKKLVDECGDLEKSEQKQQSAELRLALNQASVEHVSLLATLWC